MGVFDGENYNGGFTGQSNKRPLQNSVGDYTDVGLTNTLTLRTTIYTYDDPVNGNDFRHTIQDPSAQNVGLPATSINSNILNNTSLPSALEVVSGSSGSGSAMQFTDSDGTPYGCGYYRTLGFSISNYQGNNNAYGLGYSNNNKKWQPLSAEKRSSGVGDNGGTPDVNSEWSWPKMYLSIDEYDSLSDSWVHCKSLFQIHKDYDTAILGSNEQLQLDDTAGDIGLSSHKETYTPTGLVPLFVTIEPSAYQLASNIPAYTGPQDGADYGWGEGNGLEKYSWVFKYVINAGNPMMRGTIAVPFGDAESGVEERSFRYRVHYVNERFFQHAQIAVELENNAALYPSFTDDNEEHLDIDEMRFLLEYACDTGFNQSIVSEIEFDTADSGPIPPLAGNCVPEVDGDVLGCMDSDAIDYNPEATDTDCNCRYCGPDTFFSGWANDFAEGAEYVNNNGTCNPSLGFNNVSNAMQIFGAQVTGGQSLPDDTYGSMSTNNVATSSFYNSIAGVNSQSQLDHTHWIQIDNAQNTQCSGSLVAPIFVACVNSSSGEAVPLNTNLYSEGFVNVATNNIYNNVWMVEPGETYQYVIITSFNVNLCSDCDVVGSNTEVCPFASEPIQTQPCDEDPSEVYVCMCEDCDDHFTLTKLDCSGNDITDLLGEFGPNWEGWIEGSEQCPCADNVFEPSECELSGEWTELSGGLDDFGTLYLNVIPSANLSAFESQYGILAFSVLSGANNVTTSANYLNEQTELDTPDGVFITGQTLSSGAIIFPFNNLPSGNVTIKSYTLEWNPETEEYVIICSDSQTIYIDPPVLCTNSLNEFSANGEDVSCIGSSDGIGSITQVGNNAEGPYTITVSNADGLAIETIQEASDVSSQQFSDLSPGFYTVDIVDNNDCAYSTSFVIGEPTPIVFSVLTTNVTSFGGNDGTATVNNVTGGAGNYIIEWTDQEGNSVNNYGLASGVYTVTVTDANGCFVTTTVTLAEATCDLTVSGVVVNPDDGSTNGSINLSFSGGLAPYSIDWIGPNDFEASTSTISNLDVGVYHVQVCSNTDFSNNSEDCCAYATFTLINGKGECITEDNEKLILDKVNEILSSCDCVLPEVENNIT